MKRVPVAEFQAAYHKLRGYLPQNTTYSGHPYTYSRTAYLTSDGTYFVVQGMPATVGKVLTHRLYHAMRLEPCGTWRSAEPARDHYALRSDKAMRWCKAVAEAHEVYIQRRRGVEA